MSCTHSRLRALARRRAVSGGQRGVVLLFALISVLIVMIAAVALIRSMNSSMFLAGNIAFKRDLQNESDAAIQRAMQSFGPGGALATHAARGANVSGANYSATQLATASVSANQRIPLALQSASAMTSAGFTDADLVASATGVKTRYVVERLCDLAGDETTLGTGHCLVANAALPGGQGNDQKNAGVNPVGSSCGSGPCQSSQSLGVVYRVTVRAEGPRNTLSFFQSTLTAP